MESGYQGHLHNFTVSSLTFQRTFTYSRAVLSKCLLKEANPKSLSRYFLPKTIRSSPIDFHSQRNDRSRRNCFKLGETGLPMKRRKPKASSRYPNIGMKPRLKKVRQISSFFMRGQTSDGVVLFPQGIDLSFSFSLSEKK